MPGLATKKLHKLLYYCQGHHLAVYGEPLFAEEICAWDMGPVVASLWREERQGISPLELPPDLPERALNTIGYVISRYGALNGTDLEHLTHSESPWASANSHRRPGGSVVITTAAIAAYFHGAGLTVEDSETTPIPDDDAVTAWLANAGRNVAYEGEPDSIEELMKRLSGLGAS